MNEIRDIKELFKLNEKLLNRESVEIPQFILEDAKFVWEKLLEVYNG